jgi:hypothetical protein
MRLAMAIVFLCLTSPAQAHQFNCDEVRAYVAQHGRAKALAAAIHHGATWREILVARKCLRKETR